MVVRSVENIVGSFMVEELYGTHKDHTPSRNDLKGL